MLAYGGEKVGGVVKSLGKGIDKGEGRI